MTFTLEITDPTKSQPGNIILRKTGFRSVGAARNYYAKSQYFGVAAYQIFDAMGYAVDAG